MRTKFSCVRNALAELDAARRHPGRATLDGRALADLAAILDSGPASGSGSAVGGVSRGSSGALRRDRRLVVAALTGVVALGAALVLAVDPGDGGSTGSGFDATPVALAYSLAGTAGTAHDELLALADRAAALPDTAGPGRFDHVRYQQWSLFTRIDDKQVTSAVVPQQAEQWLAADGTGKLVQSFVPPASGNSAELKAWRAAGSPGRDEPASVVTALSRMWTGRPPTDAAALAAWLQQGHPVVDGPPETVTAISDLVKQEVLTPQERAAVLRVLAGIPGLVDLGTTTDRAGRPALGVAVDGPGTGLPTRYTLLVDPSTGTILGFEQTLTQSAGKLNVPVPAVIGYDLYLQADRTAVSG